MENNKFGLNINVLKNPSQIIKPQQDKRKQLMRKPLPFNMNFWKSNNDLPLPRNDQNREYLINKSNKSPLILNHPFNKKVIRFHNKNSSEILNPNKIKYYSYFRKNPFEADSYDLLKASWDVSKKNKPTEKLRSVKLGNPFIPSNKHKTNFGFVYSAGGIPCRIEHGGVNLKLNWSIPIEKLDYDPILITCFEGLLETEHPYNFVGKQCIRELLAAEGAKEKVEPILSKLIGPLKDAIKCDNPEIFGEAMNDLQILSNMVKDKLNKYVHFFLQNLNKKSFNPKYKERVFEVLKTLEENGGPEVFKEIKRKIPTYTSL
jgi:hypothetical protein